MTDRYFLPQHNININIKGTLQWHIILTCITWRRLNITINMASINLFQWLPSNKYRIVNEAFLSGGPDFQSFLDGGTGLDGGTTTPILPYWVALFGLCDLVLRICMEVIEFFSLEGTSNPVLTIFIFDSWVFRYEKSKMSGDKLIKVGDM